MLSERASFDADGFYRANAPHQQAIEQVIEAMRGQVTGALPLSAMAEIAHLSPFHFARTFRRVTGIPPGEFMTALRLERAKQLLLTTDLSVSEVCFEVGYSSPGTFTTRFGQLVGLPPARMRRLPEEVDDAYGRVCELLDRPIPLASARDAGVVFRVHGSDLVQALVFVGLFPGAIPQGRPVAGALLTAPGIYQLNQVPDGLYHLMVAALPLSGDPVGHLMPGAAMRVGRGQNPVMVRAGQGIGSVDVEIRPLRVTDPPVLVALPALLLQRPAPGRGAPDLAAAMVKSKI